MKRRRPWAVLGVAAAVTVSLPASGATALTDAQLHAVAAAFALEAKVSDASKLNVAVVDDGTVEVTVLDVPAYEAGDLMSQLRATLQSAELASRHVAGVQSPPPT